MEREDRSPKSKKKREDLGNIITRPMLQYWNTAQNTILNLHIGKVKSNNSITSTDKNHAAPGESLDRNKWSINQNYSRRGVQYSYYRLKNVQIESIL